jgi:hypothetical protein
MVPVAFRVATSGDDRVDDVLELGIVINLVTFVLSGLNSDISSAREIAPVLPMSAIVAARVLSQHRKQPIHVGRNARLVGGALAVAVAASRFGARRPCPGAGHDCDRAGGRRLASRRAASQLRPRRLLDGEHGDDGQWRHGEGAAGNQPRRQIQGYAWKSRSNW